MSESQLLKILEARFDSLRGEIAGLRESVEIFREELREVKRNISDAGGLRDRVVRIEQWNAAIRVVLVLLLTALLSFGRTWLEVAIGIRH